MKIFINSLLCIGFVLGQVSTPIVKSDPDVKTGQLAAEVSANDLMEAIRAKETPSSANDYLSGYPLETKVIPTATQVVDNSIHLTLNTNPPAIPANGQITIHWSIDNLPAKKPEGMTLQLILPQEVVLMDKEIGTFNLEKGVVTLPVTGSSGSIHVSATTVSTDVIISGLLMDVDQVQLAAAYVSIPIRERFNLEATGGEISARAGKLKVKFQENTLSAFSDGVEIEIGTPAGDETPAYSMSGKPFEIKAFAKKDNAELKHFDELVKFEIDLTDYGFNTVQSGDVILYWYNPEVGEWQGMASLIDPETKILTALTDHFSIFDIGPNNWEASKTPSVNSFQVANFTGAATYSMPIEVPPGPGGLQPNLSLNYNSQVVDEATRDSQASWVGMGWSLESGSIVRNSHNNTNNGDDSWYLNIDGVSTEIIRTPTGEYYAADENFMKISYTANNTWTIWDKQGNIYYFDYAISMVYQETCPGLVTLPYKWSLTRVRNIFGKELVYQYTKETKNITFSYIPEGGSWCNRTMTTPTDTASYPSTITYPDGRTRVRFVLEGRFDYTSGFATDQIHHSFDRSRLNQVVIERDTDGNGTFETLMKFYDLTYSTTGNQVWPNIVKSAGGKLSTLVSVQEFGAGGSDYLPATTFNYNVDFMHLSSADNGYGGVVTFDYYDAWYYNTPRPSYNMYFDRWGNRLQISTPGVQPLPLGYGYIPILPGRAYSISANLTAGILGARVRLFNGYTFQESAHSLTPSGVYILPATANTVSAQLNNDNGYDPNHNPDEWTLYLNYSSFQALTTIYRVSQKTINDGNGHSYPYTYIYSDAAVNDAYHSAGTTADNTYDEPFSQFRGHASVTETAPDGTQTITSYLQDDVYRGRAYNTKVIIGGKKVSETITTYSHTALQGHYYGGKVIPRYWIKVDSTENRVYNNEEETISASKTLYSYETTYGNLVSKTEQILNAATWQNYRTFDYYYNPVNNGTQYLVGLPARQLIKNSSNTVIAETLNIYDSNTTYNQFPTVGKLSAVRTWMDGLLDTGRYSQASYGYDGWGNQTTLTTYNDYANASNIPTGARTTYTCYGGGENLGGTPCANDGYHTYPLWSKNPLGQITNITYDYALGVPLTERDANYSQTNDTTITAEYDVFGRITKLIRPNDSSPKPTIEIEYLENALPMPFTTTVTLRMDGDHTYTIIRKYDGMGRQYYMSSGGVITNTIYENPNSTNQSAPHYASETANYTTTTFDPAQRKTTVTAPDGTYTSTSINGLTNTFIDANRNSTVTVTDIFGRTVSVTPQTGPAVTYAYDELNRLLTTNRGGAITAIKYDLAGRKIAMDDPDMGISGTVSDNNWAWNYGYDALGNLTRQVDAKGQVICLYYDNLNRLKGKKYFTASAACPADPGTSNYAVENKYDDGINGKGRRTSMTDTSGIPTSWEYDTRGRMIKETKTISDVPYTTVWGYNSADLNTSITYPGTVSETVDYTYNSRMLLETVDNPSDVYASSILYDSAGRMTHLKRGNNLLDTAYIYNPWTVQGGRLQNISTGTLQNLSYTYDSVGNITTITDANNSSQKQCFRYDTLDRLTNATTYNDVILGCTSQIGLGNYNEVYVYDGATGNLTSKNGLAYTYGSPAHIHAVTSLSNGNSYIYDANGNMTKRNSGGQSSDLGYDKENRLITSNTQNLIPTVISSALANPSPASGSAINFTVTFSEPVTGVGTADFNLTTTGSVSGATVSSVSGSGNLYTVTVNTGNGSGTIRLGVPVNATIINQTGNSLSNLPFTNGGTYTIDKAPPTVVSSIPANANPNYASVMKFTVTFSEPVTGVDGSDFNLTATGVTGTIISAVSGSGTTYTVTVAKHWGTGTIRLNVIDNNSIVDAALNPLGGASAGDGNFTTGGVYTVYKSGGDRTGVFRPSSTTFYLKNSNTAGFADITLNFGQAGDYPVAGDWDGNGTTTIGVYRNGVFYLSNTNTTIDMVFGFGSSGDQPVVGDWNGDGVDTIGVYRSSTYTFYLRNSNTTGAAEISFSFGLQGDTGIAGDWNGDGVDTIGVFRPSTGSLYLKNTNAAGNADIAINYGIPGDLPVTGDWNDDGVDTIGVYRAGNFYLRNSNTNGYADIAFGLGGPGDLPITGNWDGATVALQNPGVLALAPVSSSEGNDSVQDAPAKQAEDVGAPIVESDSGTRQINISSMSRSVNVTGGDFVPSDFRIPVANPAQDQMAAPLASIFSNTTFTYDGDGKRVKSVTTTEVGTSTTYFLNQYYEITDGVVTKYYYAGAQRIAMRKNGTLNYILGDHLGSTSVVTNAAGALVSKQLYTPWGETRYSSGLSPTQYQYTGQYSHTADFGLMYYNARWYDPALGRFAQADSIVPPGVQGLDRYAYGLNNPSRYTDPTGHVPQCDQDDWVCQTHWDEPITYENDEYSTPLTEEQAEVVEFLIGGSEIAVSTAFEPIDWLLTLDYCFNGECSPWMLAGLLPFIPSSAGKHADDIIDIGKGFDHFRQLKKAIGDAGDNMEWHHIVEQSQIKNTGFFPQRINSIENVLAVDKTIHSKISGFYSSIQPFSRPLRVRDWLAGQSFSAQYDFGIKVLRDFGVIK